MRTTATLGLGMATFVPNYGLKPGEVASSGVVLGAIRDGFRYIDTAASYGGAEAALGETASALAAVGARVATKVAATRAGDVLSSAEIVNSVEASLLRLKVTGVDTLLWHSASPDALRSDDVATAARHVRARGWALRSGASTYGGDDAVTALSQSWCQVLQFEFSLLNQSVWQRIEGLRAPTKELVARSVLCKGLLTERWRSVESLAAPLRPVLERLEGLAAEWGMTLPELAIRFALDTPGLDVVLVGIGSPEELATAVAARDRAPLTPSQWRAIAAFDMAHLDVTHPERWTHV